jgi:Tol biopolymer transport system component
MTGSRREFRVSSGAALGTAAAAVALAWTAALSAGPATKTTLASMNAAGTGPGNGSSQSPTISANARFVAFQSGATDLASPATTSGNVFVRDVKAKKTRLVTRGASGTGGNGDSFSASISGNGRWVAFESAATDLTALKTSSATDDVLVTDLKKGTTTLVSMKSGGGGGGNDDSSYPSVNGDGRFIAFGSRATDLVAQAAGGSVDDVFVRDMKLGTTILVSVKPDGAGGGNDDSLFPRISPDGRFIAFESFADNLESTGGAGARVLLRDIVSGTTELVSVNQAGTGNGNRNSAEPCVALGGRFVVFDSSASDLAPLKTSTAAIDVFLRDMKTGTTRLVSVNAAGTSGGNYDSYTPSVSADGRYVLFASQATDLVANAGPGQAQIYVRDLKKGKTTLVSLNSDGTAPANKTSFLFGTSPFTPNGKFAAFESQANDLVPGDTNLNNDVFVRKVR